MKKSQSIVRTELMSAQRGRVHDWQHWAPIAAVIWSLIYGILGVYWAVSGGGFPFPTEQVPGVTVPMAGQFGLKEAWAFVIAVGLPAMIVGVLMLRGVRVFRLFLIIAGGLFAGVLLLFMIDLNLLAMLAYIPFEIFNFFTGADISNYLKAFLQWTFVHQVLCLIGGFLWLMATVTYARRSGDSCLYCGRRDSTEKWNSPERAARWGRTAVYVAIIVPVLYAFTRYAWALGIPLGMSMEHLRLGQESGEWISGLFLANVGLVGGVLMLGLVQRWGEVFPRWMIGLAGRRVPIALAVVPASIMVVLFLVGGISAWAGLVQMSAVADASQSITVIVGPVLLFPIWGVSLAVATLGYYYRRRGVCKVCGRGAISQPSQ